MAMLTLQCDDRSKQYAAGPTVTIGRLPDNTIVIDSPAVSGHHACVFSGSDDQFVVEDLQSTNGTFVNGVRVSRQVLEHQDVIKIGRHELVLDRLAEIDEPSSDVGESREAIEGRTVFVDRRKLLDRLVQSEAEARKEDVLLARLNDIEAHSRSGRRQDSGLSPRLARLRVVSGSSDRDEYTLDGHTSLIGAGRSSLVRLRGWFKPKVSVVITRNRQGYVATVLAGDVLINNQPASGRHELNGGDLITAGSLIMEFRLEESAPAPSTEAAADTHTDSGMGCWM